MRAARSNKAIITRILTFLVAGTLLVALVQSWNTETPEDIEAPVTGDLVVESQALQPADSSKLTFEAFKQVQTEQEIARRQQEFINNGTGLSSFYNGFMGVVTDKTATYLAIPNYRLRIPGARPFRYRGQNWIVYSAAYSAPGTTDSLSADGAWRYRTVPFRLSFRDQIAVEKGNAHLLIPVAQGQSSWLSGFLLIASSLATLLLLYVAIGFPAKVLLRISQGKVFTDQSIRQLGVAAWTWLLTPFAIMLLQVLFWLIFYRPVYTDLLFMPFAPLQDMMALVITGLIILAVAQAFKRGLALQHEQALTI